jgi:alcohol dehydrogenase
MKAVVENAQGNAFSIKNVEDPKVRRGAAVVKILAAHVVPFAKEVLDGSLGYMFPEGEFIPGTGAIGIIEEVAEDIFEFKAGDLVFCDPRITSPTSTSGRVYPDGILIGWTGFSERAINLQNTWKNSTFAEKALWPQECLTKIDSDKYTAEQLSTLNYLTIAYGGFLKGGFKPGQTALINGGTGGIGSAAVMVALAMGAGKVVTVGLEGDVLEELVALDPKRVVGINSSKDFDEYTAELMEKTGGAHVILDVLGGLTTPKYTLAAMDTLYDNGSIVFIGGVRADIPVNYAKLMLTGINVTGSFMYPRTAPDDIMAMINGGLIDLDKFKIQPYKLDDFKDAADSARNMKGLNTIVLLPNEA